MAVIVRGKNARKPYTVRYWINGRQRERSFPTSRDARDFKTKVEYEAKAQIFVDPRLSSIRFGEYARGVLDGLAVSTGTRSAYASIFRTWVEPWVGDRTLKQVAEDREGFADLLNRAMHGQDGKLLSYNRRGSARTIVLAVVSEAVRAGRLSNHRLADIGLVRSDEITQRRDFVFPAYRQIENMSVALESFGPVVWLMRGCGLRIREALAVECGDFRDGGAVLRVIRQSSVTGDRAMPLKHRKPGEYRDVPVPGYLWSMVEGLPKGPVCPNPNGLPYFSYSVVYKAFIAARNIEGIEAGFTPHSLRHTFATALLANLVPITDVAEWLGHREISVTYRIYAHLIPSAASRARSVLDSEYQAWHDSNS